MELIGPVVGIAIQVGITVGLALWARAIQRKHAGLLWRLNVWVAPAAMALWVVGSLLSGLLLLRAFDGVASTDAASRATLLARGISEAMNTSAFFFLTSLLLYLGSAILCIVGAIKPAAPREPTVF